MYIYELNKPDEISSFKQYFNQKGKENFEKSLLNQHPNRSVTWSEIKNRFESKGFTQLGAGLFGSVFRHPDYPFVLKVFRKDDAYVHWLSFVKQHQHNIHVPQLKGNVTRIKDTPFSFIRMEPLEPTGKRNSEFERIMSKIINLSPEKAVELLKDASNNRAVFKKKDLAELIKFFKETSKGTRYQFDLHDANYMWRNRTPVIVDPFADMQYAW